MASKLCVILTDGPIAQLGGIRGPITTPTRIDVSAIISMVNSGMAVYEVNPRKHTEKKRLTFANINTNNFPVVKKPAVPETRNPYKIPQGKRNTVVVKSSEVDEVKAAKDAKKEKAVDKTPIPVTTSDF